jgi:hypothetical protein
MANTVADGSGLEEQVRFPVCAICCAAQAGSLLDAVYGSPQGKAIRDVTQNLSKWMVALDALGLAAITLIPLFQN